MKRKTLIIALVALLALTLLAFAGCAPNAPKGTELISNAAFANSGGMADGWYFTSYADTPAENYGFLPGAGPDGQTACFVFSENANDARFQQTVPVKPYTNYKLSVWCKAEGVALSGTGGNISVLGVFEHSEDLLGDTDWKLLTFYGVTVGGQREVDVALRLGFYSGDNTGKVYFAAPSMVEVDESEIPAGITVVSMENKLGGGVELPDADGFKNILIIAVAVLFAAAVVGAYFIMRRCGIVNETARLISAVIIFAAALLLRVYYASSVSGFDVDINCFGLWGQHMISTGPFAFYGDNYFCDYPPLYMMVLAIPAAVNSLFSWTFTEGAGLVMLKLPAIVADLLLAGFIFRVADKKYPKISLLLAAAVLFNPAVIVDSASWGQVDSVLSLFLVLSVYYIIKNKMWLSVTFYLIALLLKPQALIIAPIMLAGAILFSIKAFRDGEDGKRRFRAFLISLAGVAAVYLLFTFTMNGLKDASFMDRLLWLGGKYFTTMGSYSYGTVNAANLLGLLGGQWAPIFNEAGITGNGWMLYLSLALMAALFGVFAWRFIKERKNRSLFLFAAFTVAGLFAVGPYMHERYIYIALPLLLMAFIVYGDRRLLYVFAGFSAVSYINIAQVLYLHNKPETYFKADDPMFLILSAATVALFGWLAYLTVAKRREDKALTAQAFVPEHTPEHTAARDSALRLAVGIGAPRTKVRLLNKRDYIIMLSVTVIYAVITLLNLGSLNTPESYWEAQDKSESVIADFGTVTTVQRGYININICNSSTSFAGKSFNGGFMLEYSEDGENWQQASFTVEKSSTPNFYYSNGDMFKWTNLDEHSFRSFDARYVRVTAAIKGMRLNELVFFSAADADSAIPIVSVTGSEGEHGSRMLFDEQSTAVTHPSYYTGMYFDEIYHARTAYEMINGWKIYEWTHPPLGKAIMSLGIRIFGMNPFGWRFMGNLMGILMLPAMYILGKLLFKKTHWATALMLLMTLDGMHFIQTRLATIDSYGVFFIILMYLFMFKYCSMSWHRDSLLRTFVPLGLSGIAFGLGIASKWIGVYAGVGLAIIFFCTVALRLNEARKLKKQLNAGLLTDDEAQKARQILSRSVPNLIFTLAFCVGFFVIIPLTIYGLSYGSYFNAANSKGTWLKTILTNQTDMLSYHQGITNDTNAWQSRWFEWPIMGHTYWYYSAPELSGNRMGTIAAMGNPLVWWAGFASTVASLVLLVKKLRLRGRLTVGAALDALNKDISLLLFVFIGLGANFCAWMLISRSTFIYHYFASLPFIMIFTVYILRTLQTKFSGQKIKLFGREFDRSALLVCAFFAACLVLACMFYPVWSGVETSKEYVGTFLWWIPGFNPAGAGRAFGWYLF